MWLLNLFALKLKIPHYSQMYYMICYIPNVYCNGRWHLKKGKHFLFVCFLPCLSPHIVLLRWAFWKYFAFLATCRGNRKSCSRWWAIFCCEPKGPDVVDIGWQCQKMTIEYSPPGVSVSGVKCEWLTRAPCRIHSRGPTDSPIYGAIWLGMVFVTCEVQSSAHFPLLCFAPGLDWDQKSTHRHCWWDGPSNIQGIFILYPARLSPL